MSNYRDMLPTWKGIKTFFIMVPVVLFLAVLIPLVWERATTTKEERQAKRIESLKEAKASSIELTETLQEAIDKAEKK